MPVYSRIYVPRTNKSRNYSRKLVDKNRKLERTKTPHTVYSFPILTRNNIYSFQRHFTSWFDIQMYFMENIFYLSKVKIKRIVKTN